MTEIEWRRRWKPNFAAEPWRRLPVFQVYFVKCHFDDVKPSYEALITDCTSTWYESVNETELRRRTKTLNPSVEAPMAKLHDHIREQVEGFPSGTDFSVSEREDDMGDACLQLTVTSRLAGLLFVWKFNASPADKAMISENLTLPLLTMVSESQRRQHELFKLLAAKDKEIEDLRAQGAKSTRRHLETGQFDETVFFNNMDTSTEFEDHVRQVGSKAFGMDGQKLYKEIMTKRAWIQSTPFVEPEGESLIDDTSDPSVGTTAAESWANRIPTSVIGQSTTTTLSPTKSPANSPSPLKRPAESNPEPSPTKDTELVRRHALERRLQEEEIKKEQKSKKKKKMKF